jgi:hypothetical protein
VAGHRYAEAQENLERAGLLDRSLCRPTINRPAVSSPREDAESDHHFAERQKLKAEQSARSREELQFSLFS